jgi:hypothetical protein
MAKLPLAEDEPMYIGNSSQPEKLGLSSYSQAQLYRLSLKILAPGARYIVQISARVERQGADAFAGSLVRIAAVTRQIGDSAAEAAGTHESVAIKLLREFWFAVHQQYRRTHSGFVINRNGADAHSCDVDVQALASSMWRAAAPPIERLARQVRAAEGPARVGAIAQAVRRERERLTNAVSASAPERALFSLAAAVFEEAERTILDA